MVTDWIIRVGDGTNFVNASKHSLWTCNKSKNAHKCFINNATPGDRLWFLKTGGPFIAVATFIKLAPRILGPLIAITLTDEDLGYDSNDGNPSTTEIHYENLYNISTLNITTKPLNQNAFRKYTEDMTPGYNLNIEYQMIVRYSKIKPTM